MNEHKYKAGDKVRVLVDCFFLKKGKIYEVEGGDEYGCSLWRDKEKTHSYLMYFHEIESATEPATEHKYKAGDKVKLLVDFESLKKGEIYEVRKVGDFGCSLWTNEEKTDYDIMCFHEIEPVTIIETNNFQSLLNQQKTERDDLEKKHQEEWENLRITK